MKAEITIPDDLFVLAEEETKQLGLTRDGFWALALTRYFQQPTRDWGKMSEEEITESLNRFCEMHPEENRLDPAFESVVRETMLRNEW